MTDECTTNITFRVTLQEKRQFKLACVKLDKSMSDVLREAMVKVIEKVGRDE